MDRSECVDAMRKYGNMVMRIALNYCKNKYDAEDITQEVFCKLVRVTSAKNMKDESETDFADEQHLKRWLIRVTINQCKSLFVTPWHKKTDYLEDEELPENSYKNEEKSDLYDVVMNLPRKYRIVIYLYYYEEYSSKEIADILEIKEATVRAQLMRGRNIIRDKLTEMQKEDLTYEPERI